MIINSLGVYLSDAGERDQKGMQLLKTRICTVLYDLGVETPIPNDHPHQASLCLGHLRIPSQILKRALLEVNIKQVFLSQYGQRSFVDPYTRHFQQLGFLPSIHNAIDVGKMIRKRNLIILAGLACNSRTGMIYLVPT